jgi:maltose O-acetyltransferase
MIRIPFLIKNLVKHIYDRDAAFKRLLVRQGAKVGNDVQIVDGFKFQYEPWYAKLIEIGDGAVISAGVRFVNHDSSYSNVFGELPVKFGKISIGRNAYIGVNTVILCGVTIGENSIIGAGSVVNRDVLPNSVAAGNPIRVISTIEDGLEKFKNRINVGSTNTYYIDFGGSFQQIKKKHGPNTTKAILRIYHDYFKSKNV